MVERKLATVLFVDLVDSTGLVRAADPEVVRRRVGEFFDRVSHCVGVHGGIVEKFARSKQFTEVFDTDFDGHGPGWIANLFNNETNNAIYVATAIPEPGTLALLVGGIGAAWLRRRRKTIA